MKFLHTLIGSLTHREFYQNILDGKEKTGFLYVCKLQVLAALFLTIIISINISAILPVLDKTARELLPPGAEVIIKDGELRTNTNPIIVPMPYDSKAQSGMRADKDMSFANLIVLDITASTTPEDLKAKDTFFLMTTDGFITYDNRNDTSVTSYKEFGGINIMIDEEKLLSAANWFKGAAKYLPFILFFAMLIGFYLLSLLAALFYGLMTSLVLKIHKLEPKPFKIAYSVGLYSVTFSVFLTLIGFIFPIFLVSFVMILLHVLFIYVMLKPQSASTSPAKTV